MPTESRHRRPIYINERAQHYRLSDSPKDVEALYDFHSKLPDYAPTPLVPLPALASELGIKACYVKDESSRLGLPSFKILGASWGTFRALCRKLDLPLTTTLDALAFAAKGYCLYACTDGNHGRAVARMAAYLKLDSRIYVPKSLDEHTKSQIASEGAHIVVSSGEYDAAVQEAYEAARKDQQGVFVQDTAFPGYEETPAWIVDGYAALLKEADGQLADIGQQATAIVTPVGVGSLAHAVVKHSKAAANARTVIAVEPDTAACLHHSLTTGMPSPIPTFFTTMTGMNCGTPSSSAWPDLQAGIDVSVTVSDYESHEALEYLKKHHIHCGPCGSATLAALRRLRNSTHEATFLPQDSVVVLLSTEGHRPYLTPLDVSFDDASALTQQLVRIDSSNVTLSEIPGNGEADIARYVAAWLSHRGIETHWLEKHSGRPSVVGVVRGSGGGRSLMLNGHVDTVTLSGYNGDALSGRLVEEDGRKIIEGRGSQDMKSGLAAAMTALLVAKDLGKDLRGDVILAAVADEEDASLGTQEIIEAGWRADAAIIIEPTDLKVGIAHKGFVWVEFEVLGVAAHGSRPAEGVDAILNTGYLLGALRKYSDTLPSHDFIGRASMHCGRIQGGTETSTYPSSCKMTVEFRTIPSQKPEQILNDMNKLLEDIASKHGEFRSAPARLLLKRPAYELDPDSVVARLSHETLLSASNTGRDDFVSISFWCDAALLGEVGVPSVVFGPVGGGLHGAREWVDVESIYEVERRIVAFMKHHCL